MASDTSSSTKIECPAITTISFAIDPINASISVVACLKRSTLCRHKTLSTGLNVLVSCFIRDKLHCNRLQPRVSAFQQYLKHGSSGHQPLCLAVSFFEERYNDLLQ